MRDDRESDIEVNNNEYLSEKCGRKSDEEEIKRMKTDGNVRYSTVRRSMSEGEIEKKLRMYLSIL